MDGKRQRVVIASDKDGAGFREKLKTAVESGGNFQVVGLSRTKTSRIRTEFKKADPEMVVISSALNNQVEVRELGGFVRKLRKHLPETRVTVIGPVGDKSYNQTIKADHWIDEQTAPELLGQVFRGFRK